MKEHIQPALDAFLVVAVVSIVDAVAGGGLSIVLKIDGVWSAQDQLANDFYQIGFGVLALLFSAMALKADTRALTLTLLGYLLMANDILYYIFKRAAFALHRLMIDGAPAPAELFPETIPGWIGWISRTIFHQNTPLPTGVVAIFFSVWIFVLLFSVYENNRLSKLS